MKSRIPLIVMILLAAFVLQTTARIEVLNSRADNYLPRTDRNPDGTFADGKWRVSQENTPRDQLHSLVQTFGLLQYVLAPFLLILAMTVFLKSKGSRVKAAAALSILGAAIAISLVLYRGYYQGLGW
jgi:hypothetical protein